MQNTGTTQEQEGQIRMPEYVWLPVELLFIDAGVAVYEALLSARTQPNAAKPTGQRFRAQM